MKNYILLPVQLCKFWYIDSPLELIRFFHSLNKSFLQLFALQLFLRTFFKPLKNEYREGLVKFSIAMGIVMKSVLIVVDVMLLSILLIGETVVFVAFIAFPIMTVALLFL